jgi:hypothetical protein
MKNSIIAFVTILFIFYLAGSFTFISFYIKEWNQFARGFICFVGLFAASAGSAMFYKDEK